MNRKSILVGAGGLALCWSVATVVYAEQADQRGFMLASSCAACHGPDGKSPGSIPSLNGKDQAFIVDALQGFKSGSRPATVMNRLAKGYSDEEITTIAAWFAAQK